MHFFTHLSTLNYYTRPNYAAIFEFLESVRIQGNIRYSDPYDWEFENALKSTKEDEKQRQEPISSECTQKTYSGVSGGYPPSTGCGDVDVSPFPPAYFSLNPLGF
ncbi:hypothetical protein GCK32_012535 [Trichostrongylus colubriformis]|uniref:Uncharacterized protein n=1 Tax=Trichostrongylus colubriformis TaxID=6319 RepID=A0AAN8G0D8_TRICO